MAFIENKEININFKNEKELKKLANYKKKWLWHYAAIFEKDNLIIRYFIFRL